MGLYKSYRTLNLPDTPLRTRCWYSVGQEPIGQAVNKNTLYYHIGGA
jgi:hypothetical protein